MDIESPTQLREERINIEIKKKTQQYCMSNHYEELN